MSFKPGCSLPYRSLLVSKISVSRRNGQAVTTNLWSLDLNAQAEVTGTIKLICPIADRHAPDAEPIDSRIEIFDLNTIEASTLESLVIASDVVEVPGNFGWFSSALERRVVRLARKYSKLSILGISSNRPKTTVLNAAGRSFLFRVNAWFKAQSILVSCRYLAMRCDGVRLVGSGLLSLIEGRARETLVETASWIRADDILPARIIQNAPVVGVVAARLEQMKGVDIGIRATGALALSGQEVQLTIIGVGPDETRLHALVRESKLDNRVEFVGQLTYPEPFFGSLRNADYVLLTNRNDEQPRLIFDAIAQGAIPICPRNKAYEGIGLDDRLFYKQGCALSLAETWRKLIDLPETTRQKIRFSLIEVARTFTLERMHLRRREWIHSLREPCSVAAS